MTVSRRGFLWAGAPLVATVSGVTLLGQGLEQFAMSAPPCGDDPRSTPQVPRGAAFKAGAPLKASLVEPGMTGTRITLSGTVSGLTCGRVQGARVDVWQADAAGVYDTAGFKLRGHQLTDKNGAFAFQTIIPGNAGLRARHLGVRVIVPAKGDFSTELFFPDDPRSAKDPNFRKELLLKMTRTPAGQGATFDLVLAI